MANKNYEGQKFGQLTAIKFLERDDRCRQYWLFNCDCGSPFRARLDHVKSGRTVSCGCYNKEKTAAQFMTHGQTHSDLHITWTNIKQRCHNPNSPDYFRYGGRGIEVCAEWQNDFVKFATDMGEKPSPEYTIERKDNNGNYCKSNCVWATRKEQANNRGGY